MRKFIVIGAILLLAGFVVVVVGLLAQSWSVEHIFRNGGQLVTLECGSPNSPRTAFTDQREASWYLEQQPQHVRDILIPRWIAECGIELTAQSAVAKQFMTGGFIAFGIGAAVMVIVAVPARQAHR